MGESAERGCECPLTELREAVRVFLRWESMLFGVTIPRTQVELDTASAAYNEARSRMIDLANL